MPKMQTMKKCSRCGKEKPLSEFTKDKKRKDGLRDHCRQCRSEEHKIWYNGPAHEKAKEYLRKYFQKYIQTEKYKVSRREYLLRKKV
jgi:NAD-dependent SIR2 family protein deacetylase